MANPKEEWRVRRAEERAAAVQRQRQRDRRSTILVIAIIGGAALAIAAGIFWLNRAEQKPDHVPLAGQKFPDEGNQHVKPGIAITYKHYPPTSGTHYEQPGGPVRWGTFGTAAQPIPEGAFVHNLEHGGIAILYKCPDGCPDLVKQLQDFVKGAPKDPKYQEVKIVVTPYSNMTHKIALVAWNWLDELDTFDSARMVKFYQDHVDRGPEDVP
jgi:hypothetical protein